MKVLGIDIGNAKTKLCLIEYENSLEEANIVWQSIVLPFTKERPKDFAMGIPLNCEVFLLSHGILSQQLDCIVVCCSHSHSYAEYYKSIIHLAKILQSYFKSSPCFLISVQGHLTSIEEILNLSSTLLYQYVFTNFYGSAYLGSKLIKDGISLDIGTTTTDVIPIKQGKIDPTGLGEQPENYLKFRYQHTRINWLGLTMTPLFMLLNTIKIHQDTYQVVSRPYKSDLIFSLLDTMPRQLMEHHAYYSHFPDSEEAREQLSQFIGMDKNLLTKEDLMMMVNQLYHQLIEEVSLRIKRVVSEEFGSEIRRLKVAVFALGEQVLAKPALLKSGFTEDQFVYLNFRRSEDLWSASSVFAMAIKGLEYLLQDKIKIPDGIS